MNISDAGLRLIKDFESLRLKAYRCSAGVPTIGYGHTKGVRMGDTCTEAQADAWLHEDVAWATRAVAESVKVPITQAMFDALTSFVFNVGASGFRKSTLLRLLNESKYSLAAGQFPRWNKSKGRVVAGLTKRRAAERALFEGNA
jgi:lysozyme